MNLKEEILKDLKNNPNFISAIETKSKEEQEQIYSEIESLALLFEQQLGTLQSIIPKTTS